MKSIPKHYKLVAEHANSYEIHDSRDKKNFHIAKRDLDLQMHAKLAKIQKFDDGGDVKSDSSDDSPSQAPVVVNVNSAPADRAPASTVGDEVSQAVQGNFVPAQTAIPVAPSGTASPTSPAAQVPAPASIPAAPSTPSLVQQASGALGLAQKGIQEKAQAESQTANLNAQALEQNNSRVQALMDGYNKSRANLDQENQSLTQGVLQSKIDPNRWFAEKSTAGKISTALGIILGGIGAGLQHSTTNQALEVVQQQIKNDIEAQKAELGKKQSLLSMNLEKYRNLDAATTATMHQMQALVSGQLQLNAAKSGSLAAKGAADYASGVFKDSWLKELPALAAADLTARSRAQLSQQSAQAQTATPGKTEASNDPAEPSAFDVAREAKIAAGQNAPRDPYANGFGIDPNKLALSKLSGALDDKAASKATEEYGSYIKAQNELNQVDRVFDLASRNATYRGRISRALNPHAVAALGAGAGALTGGVAGSIVPGAGTAAGIGLGTTAGGALGEGVGQGLKQLIALGDEHTKQYNAMVNPFLDKITKDTTGRVTPISMENLQSAMPEAGDSPQTLATKRASLKHMIASSYAFPTLKEYRLVHPNDPLVK